MEILSSIDHAFHNIMVEETVFSRYNECKTLAEQLKLILPDYIDKQCDLIGRKSEYIDYLKQIKEDNPEADIQIPD